MSKTKYVDGFVLLIPKDKVDEYKKMAKEASEFWMKYGALNYRECMLDDPDPDMIELTFPKLTKAGPDETVWFSYIEYESREHRDEVNKKVMDDMKAQGGNPEDCMNEEIPFEMKKMSYGGFTMEVSN